MRCCFPKFLWAPTLAVSIWKLWLRLKLGLVIFTIGKKMTYSLSMCSYYPVFIFLCPKIESKNYPWKKTESLNYPNSIWEILAMSQIFSMFFKNLCFLLNENSRCLDFFTDTVWILENLHKFQLIIWDIAKISRIVF